MRIDELHFRNITRHLSIHINGQVPVIGFRRVMNSDVHAHSFADKLLLRKGFQQFNLPLMRQLLRQCQFKFTRELRGL